LTQAGTSIDLSDLQRTNADVPIQPQLQIHPKHSKFARNHPLEEKVEFESPHEDKKRNLRRSEPRQEKEGA
jgi:hypothetical protein